MSTVADDYPNDRDPATWPRVCVECGDPITPRGWWDTLCHPCAVWEYRDYDDWVQT